MSIITYHLLPKTSAKLQTCMPKRSRCPCKKRRLKISHNRSNVTEKGTVVPQNQLRALSLERKEANMEWEKLAQNTNSIYNKWQKDTENEKKKVFMLKVERQFSNSPKS
ncbi:hypothetical protein ACB098_01G081500 [Castanea mollissima]